MKSIGSVDKGKLLADFIPTVGDRLDAVYRSQMLAICLLDRASAGKDEFLSDTSVHKSELIDEAMKQIKEAHEELYWLVENPNKKALAVLAPDDDGREFLKRSSTGATGEERR